MLVYNSALKQLVFSIVSHLVGGLVRLLGIEREPEAEGCARAEEDVVADSGDTTVVDLAL